MVAPRLVEVLSPLVAGRVYPLQLPQKVQYPCIRYYHAAITEEPFAAGHQLFKRYRMGIDVYGPDVDELYTLYLQVEEALRNMPEFMEQLLAIDTYEPETEIFGWTLDFGFRDC